MRTRFHWNNNEIPILQLGPDFYDPVEAARFPNPQLRYWNSSLDVKESTHHFYNFSPLKNNLQQPLALRYHGHQFQHYNPDLGDGRGFLYAQIKKNNQWFDLGTKGSGQTPYSRAGDGRLTLKGAFREALATEMLESLGVNTSKTLSFFETGENLERHDEPSPTRAAVLSRYTQGHIRIGTFQRLAYFQQIENIKKLTSYSLFFYYPDIYKELDHEDENLTASRFLINVVERSAKLAAQVMMAGFVHGVLNTDNINISGELFDYGPYRFLPQYDPGFTAAYFDQQGLYCFGRQPASFLWALAQLAEALKLAYPQLPSEEILDRFSDTFQNEIQIHFLKRLNLKAKDRHSNALLLSEFFALLQKTGALFENTFYDFNSKRALNEPVRLATYKDEASAFIKILETFDVDRPEVAQHDYFQNSKPCTLIIDELESIWLSIAEKDDWTEFEKKLVSIRAMRSVY